VRYIDSWVSSDLTCCYQLMEADDRARLDAWMDAWRDLVDFEVVPVVTSAQALERLGPRLGPPGQ
jgi:hypothetical protein